MVDPIQATDDGADRPAPRAPTTVDATESDELLSLLGDEYTIEILSTLGDDALRAREIADRTGISRQTVYRRLNGLEAAGVVETTMAIDSSGHHCKRFQIAIDELEVAFEGAADEPADQTARAGDRLRSEYSPTQ